jgi:uncharacterized protein (TIGR01777 family)
MNKNVLLTGGRGLIGSQISLALKNQGYTVKLLSRDKNEECWWDINASRIETHGYEPSIIIHLAGENIAARRWNASRKESILKSRVQGTALIANHFSLQPKKPALIISASAVGFYGNRPDQAVDETALPGAGFLAQVCQKWESALAPAEHCGIRIINARFGMVLSYKGGALKKMAPLFRAGLGSQLGNGKQMISWVSLLEIPEILLHLIKHKDIKGPVNITSLQPVSNREFTQILAKQFKRRPFVPVPAVVLKLGLGEMASELLLSGQNVVPEQLKKSGYLFRYPDFESALNAL